MQDQYLLALYYVLATLSSEGNVGELIPSTEEEVFFCFMLMIINMTLFAYILGEVSSLVLKMDNEVQEQSNVTLCVADALRSFAALANHEANHT